MKYLDLETLEAIDSAAFRARTPYPWVNPAGALTDSGYQELNRNLPDVALFEQIFGKARKYGQSSHDRYVLEWEPALQIPEPWREFIAELRSDAYQGFLRRLLGTAPPDLRFHWHYTPNGCSVSPHCDSKSKLGSHIFYFNTEEDWDPSWGGETLILDDHGRFHSDSHPGFDDFDDVASAEALGNRSLIFVRNGDSWHGVREIRCPEERLRKVFIVVFQKPSLSSRLKRLLPGSP